MSAPVYVAFRHMARRTDLEAYAREQAARLERFYGGILACRVVVEPVDPGVLRATLEIAMPGERLVVSHTSEPPRIAAAALPAGFRWLHALHQAFEAAERSLQDDAGRRRTKARQRRPGVAS